ncbi:hypothetical protein B5M09_008502 [Aphanomyces astaci]|uniref:Glycosyltransferase 2-like domain-containing protein n=1 Tax=Aphanomyces astaci TaxID=112090 RepID=A0A3R7WJH3_APHAT|nr:hypothetical protein B5M09_008502 [Aphanomyces astaci]
MSFEGLSIAVTGGAGFIGSSLVTQLLALHATHVMIIDCLTPDYDVAIKRARIEYALTDERCSFEQVNICDRARLLDVFRTHQPVVVYHLAAQAGVRRCELSPALTCATNVEGTASVLHTCSATPSVKYVVFASSSSVYGNQPTPWNELTTPMDPQSLYARTKVMGEQLCQQFGAKHEGNKSVCILRPFSVYGPQGRPDMAIAKFVRALRHRQPITLIGNTQRDCTFIDDVVQAFVLSALVQRPHQERYKQQHQLVSATGESNINQTPLTRTFNVGTGHTTSMEDVLQQIQRAMRQVPVEVLHAPANPVDAIVTRADSVAASNELGFRASVHLSEGIVKTVASELHAPPMHIAVVVATTDGGRFDLLTKRCLPSIWNQTRPPDSIVIVADTSCEDGFTNDLHAFLRNSPGNVMLLFNHRTLGASGAWNTGILHVLSAIPPGGDMSRMYIAICDDDDMWSCDHLALMDRHRSDVVVGGLIRYESDEGEGKPLSIPRLPLSSNAFLSGNPHLQGSNLYVRLLVLLQAGLFDEGLNACTDRDLMVRVLDLPGVSVECVANGAHSVHHFADASRVRLTTCGHRKQLALTVFWRKHAHRMTKTVQGDFMCRAVMLFGWSPPSPQVTPNESTTTSVPTPLISPSCDGRLSQKYALIVGITSDSGSSAVRGLLEDLVALSCASLVSTDVVILENGPKASTLQATITTFQESHVLRCLFVPLDQQRQDMVSGLLPPNQTFDVRASIAETRTRVQLYTSIFAHQLAPQLGSADCIVKPVVWILDDDKRLPPTFPLQAVLQAHESDPTIAVVLGVDAQCPPLPPAFCVRTQLVDMLSHLQLCLHTPPSDPLGPPQPPGATSLSEKVQGDYYHDLAGYKTLETPMWMNTMSTSLAHFTTLGECMNQILKGSLVTRPLASDDDVPPTPTLTLTPSIHRGGCTFVFDLECMLDANTAPPCHRRSDMVWSLLQRDVHHKRVVQCRQVCVNHIRQSMPSKTDLIDVAMKDVAGHALYQALQTVLGDPDMTETPSWVELWPRFWEQYCVTYNRRRTELRASVERIRGLVYTIKSLLRCQSAWWNSSNNSSDNDVIEGAKATLWTALESLTHRFDSAWEEPLSVDVTNDNTMRELHMWFTAVLPRHRHDDWTRAQLTLFHNSVYEPHRIESARACVSILYQVPPESLELLGVGYEGVTFHNGKSMDGQRGCCCFKYMDLAALRFPNHVWDSLVALLTEPTKSMLGLRCVRRRGYHVCLERDYVDGTELNLNSKRECAPEAPLSFLAWCRKANITCRNVKPQNLVVSRETGQLTLVDIGMDTVVPWTSEGEGHMMRKMYLSWAWLHRHDLAALLSASHHSPKMPELQAGFNRFQLAYNHMLTPQACVDDAVALVAQLVPPGGGSLLNVTIDWTLHARVQAILPHAQGAKLVVHPLVQVGKTELTLHNPFDTITCICVVCAVDDLTMHRVLLELRAKVAPHAFEPVSDYIVVQLKPVTTLCLSPSVMPAAVGGRPSHRGETTLMASCTLLIKTCATEHLTLAARVRHLKEQLEGPRAFAETLVIVDGYRRDNDKSSFGKPEFFEPENELDEEYNDDLDSFVDSTPRPSLDTPLHRDTDKFDLCDGDAVTDELSKCLAVCQELQQEGWIDRYLHYQPTSAEVVALNSKWFGLHHNNQTHTRTRRGTLVQVASTLAGLEAATSEFILQVDSDLMVGRHSYYHLDDYLGQAMAIFAQDELAISVALDTFRSQPQGGGRQLPGGPTWCDPDTGTPHRVEVRGCVFSKARLMSKLPMPRPLGPTLAYLKSTTVTQYHSVCKVDPQHWLLPWYRAMDIAMQDINWGRSYRVHDGTTFFVHPTDTTKASTDNYGLVLDCVATLRLPSALQHGHVDCQGGVQDWMNALPKRHEDVVVVVLGRNVSPSKIMRCLDSIARQHKCPQWTVGVIVVDDASSSHTTAAFLRWYCHPQKNNARPPVTLIQPRFEPRKVGANTVLAVEYVCANPMSVVVTLDMDDSLLGMDVWTTLYRYYIQEYADATVGGMLRTDKIQPPTSYPGICVNGARRLRGGGNVWMHLRSFRKYLFDRILDQDLREHAILDATTLTRGDNGGNPYLTFGFDWAMMLPLVEMATKPTVVHEVLYLYEPFGPHKAETDAVAFRLLARPAYSKLRPLIAVVGDANLNARHAVVDCAFPGPRASSEATGAAEKEAVLMALGQALVDAGYTVLCGGLGGAMLAVARGAHASTEWQEGRVVGLVPGTDRRQANSFIDMPIATGLGIARNCLVAQADAMVCVGGGSGTLSEMALAWSAGRLVIGMESASGVTPQFVGKPLDGRRRYPAEVVPHDQVYRAKDVDQVIQLLRAYLPLYAKKRQLPM